MPKAKLYNGTAFLADVDCSLTPTANPTKGDMLVPLGLKLPKGDALTLALDSGDQYTIRWDKKGLGQSRDQVHFTIT
jgi:hypothetical protein